MTTSGGPALKPGEIEIKIVLSEHERAVLASMAEDCDTTIERVVVMAFLDPAKAAVVREGFMSPVRD